MRVLFAFAGAFSLLAIPALAVADDNVECYTSTGQWNAPAGTLVLNKSSSGGPVSAVIGGIGEYYTHSAVSHGSYWGSMNTMRMPRSYPSGNSSCGAPVEPSDLANGWPGARTDPAGGLWSFYFSSGGFMNGQSALYYGVASTGTYSNGSNANNCSSNAGYGSDSDVANCMIAWEQNKLWGSSGCGSNSPGPGCGAGNTGGTPNWNFGYSVYSYSQYANSPWGYGTMCAGLTSNAFYWSTGPNGYCAPPGIVPFTYANSVVNNAAWSLYNQISSGSQGFWGTLGACFACFDCNLLDEAGDQVVDCFTNNQGTYCGQSNHDWAGNSTYGHTATSISPDRIWGISGHYCSTNNNSPWRPAPGYAVQFNQPGNYYGCWY
jgi:hypothetical protein